MMLFKNIQLELIKKGFQKQQKLFEFKKDQKHWKDEEIGYI